MCITLTAQTSVASNSSHLCVALCALDLEYASHGMYVYICYARLLILHSQDTQAYPGRLHARQQ